MAFAVDDKTEQPTERRRRQAREDGLGPRSADLSTACRLLGIAAAFQFFAGPLVLEIAQFLTDSLQRPLAVELTADLVVSQAWDAISRMALGFFSCCGCLWVGCFAAHFLQVGVRFQTQDLLPDFSRLSPANGLSKLWRIENASQAGWGGLKYVSLLCVGGWYLWINLPSLLALPESDLTTIAQITGHCLIGLAWQLAAVFLVMGLADYGYQRWKFEQSLKMSPAELREEMRNEGGNTQWKQQRRELWRRQSSE